MSVSNGPPTPPPDLSREQVISIFQEAGNAELRRHIPIMQTDGKGFIGFLCCGRTMNHDAWWTHVNTALTRARTTIQRR